MILGMTTFTLVHVLLSLIGIGSGLVDVLGFIRASRLDGLNALFLATKILTSVTGFLFPFHKFLPSHGAGLVSLIVLAVAAFALDRRRLAGAWCRTQAIAAVIALYLNVFVLVVQLFEKVPALKAIAPTQSEPPFKVTQLMVLAIFILVGLFAAKRFRHNQVEAA